MTDHFYKNEVREQIALAMSLNDTGRRQADLGDYESAGETLSKAWKMITSLSTLDAEPYSPEVSQILSSFGYLKSLTGDLTGAVNYYSDAVLVTRVVSEEPQYFAALPAMLSDLAASEQEAGEFEDAEKHWLEVFLLFRVLSLTDPVSFTYRWAASLTMLALFYQNFVSDREASLKAAYYALYLFAALDSEQFRPYETVLKGVLDKWEEPSEEWNVKIMKMADLRGDWDLLGGGALCDPSYYLRRTRESLLVLRDHWESNGNGEHNAVIDEILDHIPHPDPDESPYGSDEEDVQPGMTENYTREPLDLALSLNEDAAAEMRAGNYEAAERLLLQAVLLINDIPGDVVSFFLPQLILIGTNEAALQKLLGNSERAKELYLSLLDTVRATAVTDLRFFPTLADILIALSPLHENDGEFEEAEKLLLEANELGDHLPRSDQYNYSEHVLRSCDALAGLAHFYQRSVPDRDASINAAFWAIRLYTTYDFEGDKQQDVADLRDVLHKWDISSTEIDERVARLEGSGFTGLTLRPDVVKEPGKYLSQAVGTLNDLCEALRDRGGAGPVIAETVNETVVRLEALIND